MSQTFIYPASNLKHLHRWLALRDSGQVPFAGYWLTAGKPQTDEDYEVLWLKCIADASLCTALLFYQEPGDVDGGALFETGAALAHFKPVFYVGHSVGRKGFSILKHPLVTVCASLDLAVDAISEMLAGKKKELRP